MNDAPGCFWYDYNDQMYFNNGYGPTKGGRYVICKSFCIQVGSGDCVNDKADRLCCPGTHCDVRDDDAGGESGYCTSDTVSDTV